MKSIEAAYARRMLVRRSGVSDESRNAVEQAYTRANARLYFTTVRLVSQKLGDKYDTVDRKTYRVIADLSARPACRVGRARMLSMYAS